MKPTFFAFVALLSIILTGCKDKAGKADDLRLEDKFEEAAELYKQAADEGNAYAKWRLARAYGNGDGVDYNEEKAWSLLNEASKEGCPQATCDVALAYIYGWYGIEKDEEKGKEMLVNLCKKTQDSYSLARYAFELLSGNSFEKNEAKAMAILEKVKDKNAPQYLRTMSYIYFSGTDKIEKDLDKAIEFLTKAYENGSASAAYSLGTLYSIDNKAFGKSADHGQAIKWFENGIKRNDTESMMVMARICLTEDTVYEKWHDVNKGISLCEKAARHGDGDGYAQLGLMYGSGDNVYKDEEKSFEYYTKSYELRSAWGTNNLGACYIEGTGCEKDIDKALELFQKASDWGQGKASENLYKYYYYSNQYRPHKTDKELAKKYILLSVKQGNVDGNKDLAYHYYNGTELFEKNVFKAFDYYKQAADMGDIDACQQVAYMYENGIGCKRDPDKAKKYGDKTKPKDADKTEEKEKE